MPSPSTQIKGTAFDAAFGASGIADTSAPTVAEVDALTRIECGIVGDNPMDTPRSGETIDVTALCNRESVMLAGTVTNDPVTGTFFRYSDSDDYWILFDDSTEPTPTQHLVVCRQGFTAGTPTAGDVVDVYTVQVMHRNPQPTGRNETGMFEVQLAVQAVQFDATVAA